MTTDDSSRKRSPKELEEDFHRTVDRTFWQMKLIFVPIVIVVFWLIFWGVMKLASLFSVTN